MTDLECFDYVMGAVLEYYRVKALETEAAEAREIAKAQEIEAENKSTPQDKAVLVVCILVCILLTPLWIVIIYLLALLKQAVMFGGPY